VCGPGCVCVCEGGPAGHLLATCIDIAAVVIALSLLSQQRQPMSVHPCFFFLSHIFLFVWVTPPWVCVCVCKGVETGGVGAGLAIYAG